MKNDALVVLILILFFSILGATYCARDEIRDYLIGAHQTDTVFKEKIDTIWKDTTITKEKLVPMYIEKVRVDTLYDNEQNPIELITENKHYKDTLLCEKDTAEITISITGIKSNVDSISLKLKKSEIIKTNTVTVTKYVEKPRKRLHFAPNVSTGYGFINKNIDVYIGFGLNYEL